MTFRLEIKHLVTTLHHLQANGPVKRFNRTIVTSLWHYFVEHWSDWDQYVQPMTYVYNKLGPQIKGHNAIQPGAVCSVPCTDQWKHGQCYTKHDGAGTLVKLPPSIMRQSDVLQKQMDAKLATAQAHHKRIFDRTVHRTPPFSLDNTSLLTDHKCKWMNEHAWRAHRYQNYFQGPSIRVKDYMQRWIPSLWLRIASTIPFL